MGRRNIAKVTNTALSTNLTIFLNVCPFDYKAVAGSWKVRRVKRLNHTSWVAVVTPTDVPKSIRNCCVISLLCGVVCIACPFDSSAGVGAFVIGLSQISSFFSSHRKTTATNRM